MAEATEKPAKQFTLDDVFALLPSNLPFFNHFSLGNVHCADLEISFLKCAEVTGLKNSKFKCKEQLDDFLECKTRMTDRLRKNKIMEERRKQGRDPVVPTI